MTLARTIEDESQFPAWRHIADLERAVEIKRLAIEADAYREDDPAPGGDRRSAQ